MLKNHNLWFISIVLKIWYQYLSKNSYRIPLTSAGFRSEKLNYTKYQCPLFQLFHRNFQTTAEFSRIPTIADPWQMTSAIFLYSDLDLAIELKQFSYLYTWKDFHNFVDPSDSFDDKKPIFTQKINKKICNRFSWNMWWATQKNILPNFTLIFYK